MATVTYGAGFNNLSSWPGRLFQSEGTSSLTTKTATSAVITHGAGHPFDGFSITVAGTGLAYSGNTVIDGTVQSVIVKNLSGQVILSISNIGAATLAADFSLLASYMFGRTDAEGSLIGPDGKQVWSYLLSGGDTINGTNGNDRQLVGLDSGNDTYNLKSGDDRVAGGIGNDTYNGGNGFDTLTFAETAFDEGRAAFRGLNVNMSTKTVLDCWGGTDRFSSIERIDGSMFADRFLGAAGDDEFAGMAGRDTIDGAGGTEDKVNYSDDVWYGGQFGINANLSTGIIRDGFGNRDTVTRMEWVVGTRFNDKFTGSAKRDVFIGDFGVDSYDGKGNPADSGEGDRIHFNWTFTDQAQGGIDVDLSLATGQIINDGYGNTENAINIEGIIGSNQNDVIKGGGGNNIFAGADGQDTMTGRLGANEYVWWDINHFGDGDIITDFVAAKDKLSFDKSNFQGMDVVRIENDLSPATNLGTFLFDTVTDTLYWDANGSGAGQRFAIVELTGVASLSASNFELF
jgi:Ca2+-binding RTX toxin-like protein